MTASTLPAAAGAETKNGTMTVLRRTVLLISFSFGILNFVLPIYGRDIGASALEIGLLFSAFSLMTVALRPLVGAGLDRFGRRGFFIAGLAAYALTMLSFAYASAVWSLLAAGVLQGIASALLWLAANAIIADISGADERARSFGLVTQASNQGAIAGTFIGFTVLFSLSFTAGWKSLFIGYAAAGLAAVIMAWRKMPETRPAQSEAQDSPRAGIETVLRSRPLSVLMLVGAVSGASQAMLAPILMIFLQEKFHAEVDELAWAFLPAALVWTFLPARMGRLADRVGRKPLIWLAIATAAGVSLLIPRVDSLAALAALWVLEAVCFTASDPASSALITDLTGEQVRGRVYGLFAFAGSLGAVAGPLLGGWLYDSAGKPAPFLVNAAALGACALIIALALNER